MAVCLDTSRFLFRRTISGIMNLQIRCLSYKPRSRRLNKYLEHVYHPSQDPNRSLVLLGTFLSSKPKYFKNLQQYYMDRGFDILYYRGRVKHILHPGIAKNISHPMAEALYSDNLLKDKQILIHAFSVGIFFYGNMLIYMDENVEKFTEISSRIRGVVVDSPATIVQAPIGIAKSLSKNELVVRMITKIFEYYYWFMHEAVANHGTRADETFARNERCQPVLMMYSKSDIVSRGCAEKFVKKLEGNKNADIFSHTWDNTLHANLMRNHTEEYFSLLEEFLIKTGLQQPEEISSKEKRRSVISGSRA